MALEATLASRAQDPGYQTPGEADWRDQFVAEVGELSGRSEESDSDMRDPGTAPGSSGETLALEDL